MTYGTSYFTSESAAIRYYRDYENGSTMAAARAVETKLREGAIHIGEPPLKIGQRLAIIDAGTRYAITEGK